MWVSSSQCAARVKDWSWYIYSYRTLFPIIGCRWCRRTRIASVSVILWSHHPFELELLSLGLGRFDHRRRRDIRTPSHTSQRRRKPFT